MAGVEPQLPLEERTDLAQCQQRVALPSGLVLRQRQQYPAAFPQRLLVHHRLGAGQHLVRVPGPQRRLDVQLLRLQVQLVESPRLDPAEAPPLKVGERLAAPERQGVGEHEHRPVRVLGAVEQRPRPLDGTHEALRVDLIGSHVSR